MPTKIRIFPNGAGDHQWWQCDQLSRPKRNYDGSMAPDVVDEIEVSSVYIANEVVQAMTRVGRCYPIRRLTIRMCEVWPSALVDVLDAYPVLEELTLHKVNQLDDKSMRRITCVSSLRRLLIHHKARSDYWLSTLFKNLDQLRNLQELRLDGSSFSDRDLGALIRALATPNVLPNLELLSFKGCLLPDKAVAQLVGVISQDRHRLRRLKTLDFSINQCYERGIHALGQLLSSPQCRLEQLDLICQLPRICHPMSVEPLSRALRTNQFLKLLRLSGNEIMETSMLECLAVNQRLECLDWCGNGLEEDRLALLSHALSRNRTLKSLNIKSNRLKSVELLNLSANDTLCHLGHSCRGPGVHEIAFWCRLNAAGRRLLRDQPTCSSLWPMVIKRCNQDSDAIYWLIRNVPLLWGTHDS
jgi:hypothetical protein